MDNVPDPTDFPNGADAPGLRALDTAFSCQICGELFDAPMILGCGHTFCSMCVRRSLRERHECPSCRNPAEEVQLVKNAQLEDLCDSWRSARATVLKLVDKVDCLAKVATNGTDTRPKKKRKLSIPDTPRAYRTACPSTDHSSTELVEDSEDRVVPSSDAEENEAQMQLNVVVDCPLCGKPIINTNANEHIDSGCQSFLAKSKTKQKDTRDAWNDILGANGPVTPRPRSKGKGQIKMPNDSASTTVERIPKPTYKVLKDKKIRELLSEYQLSTTGSREQLIARHTQFVLLFNANLDRAEHLRKPIRELREDLRKWEESLVEKKVSVDDARTYVKSRKDEFKKHTEAARSSSRKEIQYSNARNHPFYVPNFSESRTKTDDGVVVADGSKLRSTSRQKDLTENTIISDSEDEK